MLWEIKEFNSDIILCADQAINKLRTECLEKGEIDTELVIEEIFDNEIYHRGVKNYLTYLLEENQERLEEFLRQSLTNDEIEQYRENQRQEAAA